MKIKNTIITVLSVLMGLMLLNSGINKFTGHMALPEMSKAAGNLMMAFGKSGWLFPLAGIVEIIGAILFMIPKTRALGTIVLLPIVVGIFFVHVINDPSNTVGLVIAFVFLGIIIWNILDNKHKYMPMIS